ncbi:hypothetical protein AUEXF2481DRAFT_704711 [Aureobasidium subglaciale EXF-2481]|uniref:Carrier domain-containing protein n=1 Tax=Aureobasidium subglaciale (strain EXF-2481) TaxID=1043005 RepID=A0A074Y7M5_AURSE|nr:uncharacterized protein AUEXF2481DRAFT_704711 [Aureobasidium subglaciale EXF-2481]KAI5194188.1 hypothetical protein E4T38_09662 [Aureobasidium subglaciale]KAI5213615.1 hypothetical protein E4T40_09604 [Aureobasidium subglaciale]KAI5215280.1 hypothetical protein E4T41_09642 [Aureobasidium subglaciale]KAI5253250.1 hypothetical protein E4T46_09619 [Aureobasidium subglaciale]KEQ90212.1 hypothetical protein AUEXF2481DRAFT_704711 [Aureobasidium subglaciale EXF-2481]
MHRKEGEPIAIVGSACRFPGGANTPTKLWDLLREPKDVQTRIPESRFNPEGFYHQNGKHHGTSNVLHSYLLAEDCTEFDAQFFGIKPVEANAIDPQQRLLLETTFESIDAAGLKVDTLRGSNTAVYIGLMTGDYADLQLRDPEAFPTYIATGTARSIMSNRISYFFDWHGPSMTIDTACSSSLVAVHHAVQTLRSGQSRVAIAGGSNLCLGPEPYIGESNLAMLSPTGRSRMWDAAADGYARGDGIAAVVLKTLSSALEDGDHIDCVIRETGVNQDGRTPGITMPSAAAQKTLIRDTYARAGLDLDRVEDRPQYFEAHGTGTPTGDPLEAEAISSAFFPSERHLDKLYVGSIKTVIGHTEGTAGLAGLLKASLALQAGLVPPNLLFENLAPKVAPFYQNLEIVVENAITWPKISKNSPRRASVNSFGFGGTNAHAILESYESPSKETTIAGPNILPVFFSAASERALKNTIVAYDAYLQTNPDVDIRRLAWTVNFQKSRFPLCTAISATDATSLQLKLHQKAKDLEAKKSDGFYQIAKPGMKTRKMTLGVFTGQGAQWSAMMRDLVRGSAFVRERLRILDRRLAKLPKDDRPTWTIVEELLHGSSRIREAALSQPLCTAVQIILVDLLRVAGVKLDAVVGHSSGEIGAAYCAGLISAEDAICIAYYRGLCSSHACGESGAEGGMLAVGTTHEDVSDLCSMPGLDGRLAIAACNSSTSFTLSGDRQAIELAKDAMVDEGKFARLLQVDKAYHSHHMIKCSQPYLAAMQTCQIQIQSPERSKYPIWYSSVRDAVMGADCPELTGTYWNDNMVNPVLFAQAVECATAGCGPFELAIEIGPHAALKGPALQVMSELLASPPPPYIGILDRKKNDLDAIADFVSFVVQHSGWHSVDMRKLDLSTTQDSEPMRLLDLPSYGWNHDRRYWHESRVSRSYRLREPINPLLGVRMTDGSDQEFRWRNFLSPEDLPLLTGHMIQGQMIFPAAGYISACVEAANIISRDNQIRLIELLDVTLGQALVFEDEKSRVETLFSVTNVQHINRDTLEARFVFYSALGKETNNLSPNASGTLRIVYGSPVADTLPSRKLNTLEMVDVPADRLYAVLKDIGYGYTGPFRALKDLRRKAMESEGLVSLSPDARELGLIVDPAMLDATIQSIMLARSYPGDGRLWSLHVPQRIDRVSINHSLCSNARSDPYFETSIHEHDLVGIMGDVKVIPIESQHAMIQMEGVLAVPLDAATPEHDRVFFSQMFWDHDTPKGDVVAFDGQASPDDYALAYILERVSHFYLKRINDAFGSDHPSRSKGPYIGLLNYAKHIVHSVIDGSNTYADPLWASDCLEDILTVSKKYPSNIDLEMMHVIGERMPSVIRGESSILEHLKQDNLLDRYYEDAMGIGFYTQYLARLVQNVVHRYPHMNILELGAGTGGATKHIMRAIQGTFKSYTFTDISSGFFENARELFHQYEDNMAFQVLDLEKDIDSQNFVEGSYDLIVASFVLHATSNMETTLKNVRRLLKPGGHLLMLEVTNLEQSRLGFIFGAMPGWWLGAEDGRVLSPCLTRDDWDSLLRNTGFSGIDSTTPDPDPLPFPASALVTQAIAPEIDFLRSPLDVSYASIKSGTAMETLLIVGGKHVDVLRLVAALQGHVQAHTQRTIHCKSLEELMDLEEVPTATTSVMLADLDTFTFQDMTEKRLQGLKRLYDCSQDVLWITNGSRGEEPHHNQSLGFGRSMLVEMPHVRSQFLDLATCLEPETSVLIAEFLLRLAVFDHHTMQKFEERLVWSIEPEMAFENGGLWIPRIKPVRQANDRYNAMRRVVTEAVESKSVPIKIVARKNGLQLQRAHMPKDAPVQYVSIDTQYAICNPVPLLSKRGLYLVSGMLRDTGYTAIALTEQNASSMRVPKNWVTLSMQPLNAAVLQQVYNQAVAFAVLEGMCKGDHLAVLDAELELLLSIQTLAGDRSIRLSVIINSQQAHERFKSFETILISRYDSQRSVAENLPSDVAMFLNAGATSDLSSKIAECLPKACKRSHLNDLICATPHPNEVDWRECFSDRLQSFLHGAMKDMQRLPSSSTPLLTGFDEVQGLKPNALETHIIDWTADKPCDLMVQTIQEQTRFSPERTYWLVGLTGSLGISLCRWMIKLGARTIVFTSRNPKIDRDTLEDLSALGGCIKVLAADVTSKQSLQTLYDQMCRELPPIGGVVQGAMVLHDAMLADMNVTQFNSVLAPKVEGSKNLDSIFNEDSLDFFIMFSSATCVTGNIGQSAYSVANMFMTGLAAQRRKRGLCGSAINIGAILGIGYVTRETSQELQNNLLKSGHVWMSEEDLHTLFAEAILAGHPARGLTPELNSGLRVIHAADKQKPLWSFSPKFSHLVKPGGLTGPIKNQVGIRIPVIALLEVAPDADTAMSILREALIRKLVTMLQLDDSMSHSSILDMKADDLGIDSLNAVELRSWIFKEFKTDVPVLRILGGATILDLLVFVLEKMPSELVPLVGSERQSANPMAHATLMDVLPDNTSELGLALDAAASDALEGGIDDIIAFEQEDSEQATFKPQPKSAFTAEVSTSRVMRDVSSTDSESEISTGPTTPSASLYIEPTKQDSPRASLERSLPMSSAQSNFWFLRHYIEDQSTFNITVTLQVNGKICLADLERAVSAIGQRHEALRTAFFLDELEQPMQGILMESQLRLEQESFANEAQLQSIMGKIKGHEYNLEAGEIMRIIHISSETEKSSPSYLVVGYHHINMDGISFQIVLDDLRRSYERRPLTPGILQYPDYGVRQREQAVRGEWDDDIRYWKNQFQELPSALPLLPVTSIKQRKALMHYSHLKVEFKVGNEMARNIHRTCKELKISPYHFYLAAFHVLLARYSSTSDLCIGVADGGRVENDTMTAVGLFLNVLPLRSRYNPLHSFKDTAKEIKAQAYAGMAHSRLAFDALLAELNVPRSASQSPLFQAFVDYRQSIEETQTFGHCTLKGYDYEVGRTSYDIALDVSDNSRGEAVLVLAVQESLYSQEAAQILMRSYTRLLHQFCENPLAKLESLNLHWEQDVEKAVSAGCGSTKSSLWKKTLPHQVNEMAHLYPDNLALKDALGKSLTYRAMTTRVNEIAAAILQSSASSGSTVGVLQDATADWICSMLAIMWTGRVYLPLDLRVGLPRLASAVADSKPSLILHDNIMQHHLADVVGTSKVGTINIEAPARSAATTVEIQTDPLSPAVILYTSGSTGDPKGVLLAHVGLLNNIEGCSDQFKLGPNDLGLQQIAFSFDFSVWQIFMCLANGAGIFIAPTSARRDPKALTALIVEEGITFTGATPSEYISWLRHGDPLAMRASSWAWAVSSGEQMTDVMKRQFNTLAKPDLKLFNGYGPTEASISTAKISVPYMQESECARSSTPGGYAQLNCLIYILDDNFDPVPCGVEGQIAIGGAGIGPGYLNNTALTNSKFVPVPARYLPDDHKRQGWTKMFLTGDRGILHSPDGAILIKGRVSGDTQIKLRGLRMDLGEIEQALVKAADSSIQDAVVSVRGTDEKDDTQFLVAHIVFASGVSRERQETILETMPEALKLPHYMIPSLFASVDKVPLNAHLKLDRKAAADLPLPEVADSHLKQLRTRLSGREKQLAEIWQQVIPASLKGNVVLNRTSDFFLTGGDSFSLLRLRDEIQRSFAVELPLAQMFEASSLESMAACISAVLDPRPVKQESQQPIGLPSEDHNYSLLEDKSVHQSAKIDWQQETRLEGLLSKGTSPKKSRSEGFTIILTGATGFLGKALLHRFEQDKRVAKVHCIAVRQPKSLQDEIRSTKVSVHQGNLAAPRLGLDEHVAEALFEDADVIVHNGADVNFLKPYTALRAANVGSTREIIRLASVSAAPIHYVSTGAVAQFSASSTVGESSLSPCKPKLDKGGVGIGYAATKWASEALLQEASKKLELPVTIHRPTNITGDGINNPAATDLVDSLLAFSRKIAAVPISDIWDEESELDFVSLDFVADKITTMAILDVGGQRKSTRFMHHAGELRTPLRLLKASMEQELGRALRAVTLDVWVVEAEMAGLDPLVAEVLLDTERKGMKLRFPRLVRGQVESEKQTVMQSKPALLKAFGSAISRLNRAISIV